MKYVSFTGHRDIHSARISDRLYETLEKLAESGADTFCAGGALGFDTLAAQTVIKLRQEYPWIMLHLVLPCPPEEQSLKFTEKNRQLYYDVISSADSIETVSPQYTSDCMKMRNSRLIELADICVCCYDIRRSHTGTGQTVRMAEKKGIGIINLYDDI